MYQGMKDDCNEKVKKHSGHVFRAILVKVDWVAFLICKEDKKRKTRKNKNINKVKHLEPTKQCFILFR